MSDWLRAQRSHLPQMKGLSRSKTVQNLSKGVHITPEPVHQQNVGIFLDSSWICRLENETQSEIDKRFIEKQ